MILKNRIYNENNIITMSRMPNNFIDMVITSPPYDNLRNYNGYKFDFKAIANELFRVAKQGGVIVWIVNDATVNGSETGTSFKQALYFKQIGFYLHDTMIYLKSGASYPASEKSNRYSNIFEYMFVFSKGKPKTCNLIKDKKNNWGGHNTFGNVSERLKSGELKNRKKYKIKEYGYRNNVWKYNNGFGYSTKDKIAYKHPAIFPEKLAYDHIITWSNEGDVIYDCFMGSGTVAKVCIATNRNYIGSEISEEYCDIVNERLQPLLNNLFS